MKGDSPRNNSWRRWLFGISGTIGVFGLVILIWWLGGNILVPSVKIPDPPPIPSPNAYDLYCKATDMILSDTAQEKAAISIWHLNKIGEFTPRQHEALLAKGARGYAVFKQAAAYSYQAPTFRVNRITSISYLGDFRQLARYLRYAGKVKELQKDWPGALEYYLDALRLGSDIQQPASYYGFLLSNTLERVHARIGIWHIIDHLDAVQARKAIGHLSTVIRRQPTLAAMLTEQKYENQAHMMALFRQPNWQSAYLHDVFFSELGLPNDGLTIIHIADRQWQLVLRSKRGVMMEYVRRADKEIAQAKLLYPSRTRYQHAGLIGEIHDRSFAKTEQQFIFNETGNALLLVALALQAYKVEHGDYPKTLDVLTPTYVKSIPTDPFTLDEPLYYKRKGDRYLLYSIGPDMHDDGGKPIERPRENGYQRYRISWYDNTPPSGDIVADLHRL